MAWQAALKQAIKDPQLVLIKSNVAVVIRDKYPKARKHFLVLPYENISSIFKVRMNWKTFALRRLINRALFHSWRGSTWIFY